MKRDEHRPAAGRFGALGAGWSCQSLFAKRGRASIGVGVVILAVIMGLTLGLIPAISLPDTRLTTRAAQVFGGFVIFMAIVRLCGILTLLLTKRRPTKDLPKDLAKVLPKDKSRWPSFTILVPAYKEAHMIRGLMDNLARLEYPRDKLQIIIVTEADDAPTNMAVQAQLRPPFELFATPPSLPRTKPKALNAALNALSAQKRGDIVTVYDAEDRPHPLQLQEAALALRADANLAVVQSPLEYHNAKENLLTALFALEYVSLFHFWNPALARMGLVFTLGGTSNHIRLSSLQAAGGWDSYNVTEDADLSFRLASLKGTGHAYKIGMISLPTQEEALPELSAWTGQRTRWHKGFMQTFLVHLRYKRTAPSKRKCGGKSSFGKYLSNLAALIITIGANLAMALAHVPSLMALYVLTVAPLPPSLLPWIAALVVLGYGTTMLGAGFGCLRAGKPELLKYIPLMPLYWLLLFPPALKAGWELVFRPAYWQKTTHRKTDATTLDPDSPTPIYAMNLEK